jgi:Ni,Fe-hydrogenase I large subunit
MSRAGDQGERGLPLEVGPLARVVSRQQVQAWAKTQGWGLETRARAHALDALDALERLETQTLPTPEVLHVNSTVSAALVEVARGPLVHRIECVEDRPVAWSSVAPTEWTFHPDGALQALVGTLAPSVQDRARVFVTLLDPCVACSIEVVRA